MVEYEIIGTTCGVVPKLFLHTFFESYVLELRSVFTSVVFEAFLRKGY